MAEAASATEVYALLDAQPKVDRRPIMRMHDRVAHHSWATDGEVVWATATEGVPELRVAIGAALGATR